MGQTYPQVMDEIYRKCHELGGQVSGEHGIGILSDLICIAGPETSILS